MECACEMLIVDVATMAMGNYGCTGACGGCDMGMDDLPNMCTWGLRVGGRYIRWVMSVHVTSSSYVALP